LHNSGAKNLLHLPIASIPKQEYTIIRKTKEVTQMKGCIKHFVDNQLVKENVINDIGRFEAFVMNYFDTLASNYYETNDIEIFLNLNDQIALIEYVDYNDHANDYMERFELYPLD
jgi:hypothetical protein